MASLIHRVEDKTLMGEVASSKHSCDGIWRISSLLVTLMLSVLHGIQADTEITMNHLAEDLTVINLGNFFDGNNSLLIWDYQSTSADVLQSSLRPPKEATTNSSSLTRCKHWAEYSSPFGGVQHWIGVCDKNRITRIKFNSFRSAVSLIRSIEYPKYRECIRIAVNFAKDLIAGYCLDISNPDKHTWGVTMFNGSTLDEIKQLSLGQYTSNLTDVKLEFRIEAFNAMYVLIAGNPLFLGVAVFDTELQVFRNTSQFYESKNLSQSLTNYHVLDLVASAHYLFGILAMKNDGSETVELFGFNTEEIIWGNVPLEPYNELSTMVLSKFRKPLSWNVEPRSNMLTLITVIYKDSAKISIASWGSSSIGTIVEYQFPNYPLESVFHLSAFQPLKFDDHSPEIIIVGLDADKKHLTSMFCSPEYQAVEYFDLTSNDAFGKNLTLGTIISQSKGIVIDSYELLCIPMDSHEPILIQEIGPPQLFIKSVFPNMDADLPLKKRSTLVLVGSDRDATILTVSTLTGFSPDYYSKIMLPESVEIFADQDNELSIPKDKIQMNSPQFSITMSGSPNTQLTFSYVSQLKMKFPKLHMSKILRVEHLGNDFYLLQNTTSFVIIACTQPFQYLRCSLIMSYDLPNERILSAIFYQGEFIILTGSNLVKMIYLRVISMEGKLLNNPMTAWKDIYVSQGTLRVIDNKIQVNIIASRPMIDTQSKFSRFENLRYMYSASFTSYKDIPTELNLDEELPGPMCPTLISWGYSQLKILNILSFCEDSGHTLVTLDYKSQSLDNVINRTESLPQDYPVEMCSTGFQMIVFDKNASTIVLHGEGKNGTTPVLNILNYPFQVYGMKELIAYNCVLDESFFFVLAKHDNGTFYLLAYRYDTNHNPWDRVHSIQQLSIDNPVEIVAGEVKKREVVVLVFNESSVEGYRYVMGTPKIFLGAGANATTSKLAIQVWPSLSEKALRRGISPEIFERKVNVKHLDQSYLKLENKLDPAMQRTLSPWDSNSIDIDSLLKVNSPVLGVTLEGVPSDVAVVVPRVSEITDPNDKNILGPRILPSNFGILTEENILITWNETTIGFYKDGKLMTQTKHYKVLTVFFAKNASEIKYGSPNPVLVVEGMRNGTRNITIFLNLMLYNSKREVVSDQWYNFSTSSESAIYRPRALYYQETDNGSPFAVLKLFLSSVDNRLFYSGSYRIALDKFMILYDRGVPQINLGTPYDRIKPATAFERKFGMFELLFIKKTPILLTLHQGSNALRFNSFDGTLQDYYLVDFPIDFLEFSEGSIDCEDTPTLREFICTVVSIKTTKSWVLKILMPLEFDSKIHQGVPVVKLMKSIENIKGFQPLRAVTTKDYVAIFNRNIEDSYESGLSASPPPILLSSETFWPNTATNTLSDGSLSKGSSKSSKSSVLSEKSLITIFSTEANNVQKKDDIPIAVFPFSSLKNLAPESNLLNWYFDLAEIRTDDRNKVDTVLLILARFSDHSVLAHYTIGRSRLQILKPGKIHSKKGRIVLQGVDSSIEIRFQDLFKRNWTRIISIWTFMTLLAVGLWFLGLRVLNTYNFKFLMNTPSEPELDKSNLLSGEYASFGDNLDTKTVADHPSIGDFADTNNPNSFKN